MFFECKQFLRRFTAQHSMKPTSPHIQLAVLSLVLTKTRTTVPDLHPKKILAFPLASLPPPQKNGKKKKKRQRTFLPSAAFESAIIISYCQCSCKSKLNQIIFQEGQLSICCNFQWLFTVNNGLSMLVLTSSSWSLLYKKESQIRKHRIVSPRHK